MKTGTATPLSLQVRDASGQRETHADDVAPDATVNELVDRMVRQMRLAPVDAAGRPLLYQALHQAEGRHLHGSERVGEAVETGDVLVLHPNIEAGGAA